MRNAIEVHALIRGRWWHAVVDAPNHAMAIMAMMRLLAHTGGAVVEDWWTRPMPPMPDLMPGEVWVFGVNEEREMTV